MFNGVFLSTAWAQDAAAQAGHPSIVEQAFPFLIIFAIFFFLVIRPQQRRAQNHKTFVTELKRGDSVLTSGGILGTIEGLTEQFVILQIADNVKIRVLKAQIASGIAPDTAVKK